MIASSLEKLHEDGIKVEIPAEYPRSRKRKVLPQSAYAMLKEVPPGQKKSNSDLPAKDIQGIAADAGDEHLKNFRLKRKQAAGSISHKSPSAQSFRRSSKPGPASLKPDQEKPGAAWTYNFAT